MLRVAPDPGTSPVAYASVPASAADVMLDAASTLPLPAVQPSAPATPDDPERPYGVPLPAWLRQSLQHLPPPSEEVRPVDPEALVATAFDFAYQLHDGQFRASGEPYIVHPIAVAGLLRDIGASAAVIAAGFLHDVVEDTQVTPEEIEARFGE